MYLTVLASDPCEQLGCRHASAAPDKTTLNQSTRGQDKRLAPGMDKAAKTPGWRLVFVGRRMQLFGIYRWRQSDGEPANWERHATQFSDDEE